MDDSVVRPIAHGLSQKGVRNHNERLILSLLQRHLALPASDLARLAGLSPPTVSAILRGLEADGFLTRDEPVRGRVGKPSVPMRLAPDGVLSFGLKIGRRSSDLLLMDISGAIRAQRQFTHAYPIPADIFAFASVGLQQITAALDPALAARICGIGIAAPFELWNWHDVMGAPREAFMGWKDIDFQVEMAKITDLPVSILNDATAACQAEHVYGRGKEFQDYAYFFIAAFVGGGIVLNNSLYEGRTHNAGALGSLRSMGPRGESMQLVDVASIHLLEAQLRAAGIDRAELWRQPQDWSHLSAYVDPWLAHTARELAKASLSTCAVIDFEAIVIDGAFPADVRHRLVEAIRAEIVRHDTRGLIPPQIEEGSIGGNARAIGAASAPIFSQFLLNTHSAHL